MTRIGLSGGEMPPPLDAAEARRRTSDRGTGNGFAEQGLGDSSSGLSRQDGRFDHQGSGMDFAERQNQFLDRFRHAMTVTDDKRADASEADRGLKLLAEAGISAPLPAPSFVAANSAPLPVDVQAGAPATVERIEALIQRVETAARAERLAGGGPMLSLRLDLSPADGLPGVGALTITMSASSIDVVLSRGDGQLPPDFAMAAQALADRLQARFSKRTVRILEAPQPQSAQGSGGGLDDIGRLLGGGGRSA